VRDHASTRLKTRLSAKRPENGGTGEVLFFKGYRYVTGNGFRKQALLPKNACEQQALSVCAQRTFLI